MEVESENQINLSNKKLEIGERWRIIGFWECCNDQNETANYFGVS